MGRNAGAFPDYATVVNALRDALSKWLKLQLATEQFAKRLPGL